jgi:phospholipid N-methyltransferase
MIAPVPTNYRGRIIELGAGTGALTVRLAHRCPKATILACEINPALARDTERRLARGGLRRRVQVMQAPAEELLPDLAGDEAPEFILSGIPLGSLGRERARNLVRLIHQSLRPGGIYVQFQHSLLDRRGIGRLFSRLRTRPVLWNFPPAVIYYAQK